MCGWIFAECAITMRVEASRCSLRINTSPQPPPPPAVMSGTRDSTSHLVKCVVNIKWWDDDTIKWLRRCYMRFCLSQPFRFSYWFWSVFPKNIRKQYRDIDRTMKFQHSFRMVRLDFGLSRYFRDDNLLFQTD